MQLTNNLIKLGARPDNKEAAIRQVAQILIDNGKVKPDYIEGMLTRETQENTYLGNGVAIPHGTPQTRQFINETSIAVLQVPEGVDWEDGEDAYLIVGIAAEDNEHIAVLKKLSLVVGDEDVAEKLAKTTDVNEIREALSSVGGEEATPAKQSTDSAKANAESKYIIGITACPTGVAHTYMAQEALEKAAAGLGYNYKIETQGSVGPQNVLKADDIKKADVLIIAADTGIDLSRFAGKRVYKTSTKDAINNGKGLIETALKEAKQIAGDASNVSDEEESGGIAAIYKHLMTGVSYMLPFVVAGGLLIALGFACGGLDVWKDIQRDSFAGSVFWTGKMAFELFVPILGAYIAYSIAGRAGIAPGMVGAYIGTHPFFGMETAPEQQANAGFLGAIIAGFLAGYVVKYLSKWIQLPKSLDSLKPMVILPLFGTGIVGLLMFTVIVGPVSYIFEGLTNWLTTLSGSNAALLGAILAGMMAVDMGGPVNKAAYLFGTTSIVAGTASPSMAAVMAGGMVPPLAIFIATLLFKNKFMDEERQAGRTCGILGLCFITEGAIPFAAKDPIRVIPVMVIGAATTGALCMIFKTASMVPHGGVIAFLVPGTIQHPLMYLVSIITGSIISGLLFGLISKKAK